MTLVVDAGALFSQADADDPDHDAVARILRDERGEIVTSELAVAEADHLILERLGPKVELDFVADLVEGAFKVECLTHADFAHAREVLRRYRDLRLGLTDASLVVLAGRHRTRRLLTFDERTYRTVTSLQGGPFVILPADA